jgi:single-strand DNA-binding protein
MASFNKVILMGNLTRDPELRVTPNGHTICKFGLAVNRTYSLQDGSQREETTFVDIDSFGRQAEVISKFLTKGRAVLIEGRLRLDTWETKTGDKRSKHVVVVENFQFVGSRGAAEVISKFLTKGRAVLIEGRLRLDTWETKTGDKRSKHVVVVENFQFVGSRGAAEEGSPGSPGGYEQSSPPSRGSVATPPVQEPAAAEDDLDDDVPF